jgi:hypothetical protein
MTTPRRRAASSTRIAELVRLSVLAWTATLLTASYAGLLPKMDPTFIASIFTGSLAWYGISKMEREQNPNSTIKSAPNPIAKKP